MKILSIHLTDFSNEGTYFGFNCEYGVTRRDKFFFDDVLIGPVVQDETPPTLLNAIALDANTVQLQFNEPLDQSTAESLSNYSIDSGVSINNVTLDIEPSRVILDVSSMTSGTTYTVTTENIQDLNGNTLLQEQANFIYYFFLE